MRQRVSPAGEGPDRETGAGMRPSGCDGAWHGHAPELLGSRRHGRGLLAGQSGAGTIRRFDASHLATTYACEVPRGDGSERNVQTPTTGWSPKEQRKGRRLHHLRHGRRCPGGRGFGLGAEDRRGVRAHRRDDRLRASAGSRRSRRPPVLIKERGPRRVSPFFIPSALINLVSGRSRSATGSRGPNHAVVTACSTGGARDRRCRAAHHAGRCRREWLQEVPRRRSRRSESPGSTPARRSRQSGATPPETASRPPPYDADPRTGS